MARFRLHFADGSAVSILTPRRETVETLAAVLASPALAVPPQDAGPRDGRPQDARPQQWPWPPEDARPFL